MRKTHQQLQSELGLNDLVDMVRQKLLQLPDPRNRKVKYSFHDLLMSGFAMFHFNKYHICSIDGVQHFCSNEVHCENCLSKEHQNGDIIYHHNMLCAALVHPDEREVFIMGSEPILRQDGETKNDCELNAVKHLSP